MLNTVLSSVGRLGTLPGSVVTGFLDGFLEMSGEFYIGCSREDIIWKEGRIGVGHSKEARISVKKIFGMMSVECLYGGDPINGEWNRPRPRGCRR